MDEWRVVLTPNCAGRAATAVFDGIKKRNPLRLLSTRTFKSRNAVLIYEPMLRQRG